MENKQEELQIVVQLENYNNIPTMETWWNYSQNWNTMIEGYKHFRRDKGNGGVALYAKKWTDCEKLPLRNCHE